MAAARTCFTRWGVARTRTDDIAELVGIARPDLYRYFPNKQALVRTVLHDESRQINDARCARIPIKGPPGALISRSMIDGLRMALEDEHIMALMAHENVGGAASVLADDEHDTVRMEFWQPILDHGRRRGEIRSDLTNRQVVR